MTESAWQTPFYLNNLTILWELFFPGRLKDLLSMSLDFGVEGKSVAYRSKSFFCICISDASFHLWENKLKDSEREREGGERRLDG